MEESRVDSELPCKMAHLDLMEVEDTVVELPKEKSEETASTSRVLRKRKSLAVDMKPTNRRVSIKPRKHASIIDNANIKQIEALYLNKKVKSVSQTLETIYEEPKTDSKSDSLIGGKKVKRLITFQLGDHYTKDKIKRRRAKIKKLLGNKSFINRKKIPMQVFLDTIKCLELDEVVQTETTILPS